MASPNRYIHGVEQVFQLHVQPFVRVDATCCLSDQKWSDGSCLRCGYRRFQYVVLIYEIRIGWVESH